MFCGLTSPKVGRLTPTYGAQRIGPTLISPTRCGWIRLWFAIIVIQFLRDRLRPRMRFYVILQIEPFEACLSHSIIH